MNNRQYLRIFWTWFAITFIAALFLLGIYWVGIRAHRSGFEPVSPISAEREELILTLSLPDRSVAIDLSPINSAAERLQQLEGWIIPEKLRFLSRFSCFLADSVTTGRRQQQEREFYKNAGLV